MHRLRISIVASIGILSLECVLSCRAPGGSRPRANPLVNDAIGWFRQVVSGTPERENVNDMDCIPNEVLCCCAQSGRLIVPELIQYVYDKRTTPYVYAYPLNSGLSTDHFTVGKLACYLIEVSLRHRPFFSLTGRVLPLGNDGLESERAREQMAKAYEDWFARCYDREKKKWDTPESDVPNFGWEYDLTAWERLCAVWPDFGCCAELAATQPHDYR